MADTKKVNVAFERTKGSNGATLSQLETQVATALTEVANHLDAENKKLASAIIINKV